MSQTFKDTALSNLKLEWQHLKLPKIFFGILIGGVMQWLHNIAHNYVYYLAGKYEVYGGPDNQLVDMGFMALQPSIAGLSFLPSNGLLYSLGAIAAIVALTPVFTNVVIRDSSVRVVQILWRALVVCSIAIVFRCIAFLVTILPAPAPQCTEADFNPPQTVSEILFKFDTDNGCSDLIFSSHMMYGITAACIVTHYVLKKSDFVMTMLEKWLKYSLVFVVWAMVISEAFCIVAQNRHYSVDVWIALYTVPMVWCTLYLFCPVDPAPVTRSAPKERTDLHREPTPPAQEWSQAVV